MPQTFKVDQTSTFANMILMSVAPKTKFQSKEQEVDKDGRPKWEVQVAAGFQQFGKINNEILKVGIVSEKDPSASIPPLSAVHLVGFEVGIMEKANKEGTVIGFQVWYRADGIKPNK